MLSTKRLRRYVDRGQEPKAEPNALERSLREMLPGWRWPLFHAVLAVAWGLLDASRVVEAAANRLTVYPTTPGR